jgi:acyl-CoA thioesterase-1
MDETVSLPRTLHSVWAACLLILVSFSSALPASAQVAVVGASNVEGHGVSPSEAFPRQLQAMLRAKGRRYSVTSAGIYGDTTAGVLSRLDTAVPSGTRIVIVAIGGNDRRRGVDPGQIRANFAEIVGRLRARGIQVINAGPLIRSAIQAGMVQRDGIHLTATGHHWVATRLAGQI